MTPHPVSSLKARVDRMPRLLRFLGLHLAFGAAIGVAFASIVIMSNVSDIKTLIADSSSPYLVVALLYAMNALTFASVAMGVGVMTLPFEGSCDMRDPEDREDDETQV